MVIVRTKKMEMDENQTKQYIAVVVVLQGLAYLTSIVNTCFFFFWMPAPNVAVAFWQSTWPWPCWKQLPHWCTCPVYLGHHFPVDSRGEGGVGRALPALRPQIPQVVEIVAGKPLPVLHWRTQLGARKAAETKTLMLALLASSSPKTIIRYVPLFSMMNDWMNCSETIPGSLVEISNCNDCLPIFRVISARLTGSR